MAARMQQRRGTAAQWTSANPVLGSGEIGFETDTSKFKIGNGTSTWSNLTYFANLNQILDGAPDLLNTLNEIAAAIGDDPNFITTIESSLDLKADITYVDGLVETLELADEGILLDINTINTSINTIENSIVAIESDIDTLQTNSETFATITDLGTLESTVDTISGSVETLETNLGTLSGEVDLKSPIESPSFTGNVVLPTTTSIGDASSEEISHLNGVTSAIQTQIDSKLGSTTAASTYAPLNNPTLSGTVSLPTTTSVGDVSSTEIGYLNGVTSSVQTQLTDLDTTKADLESPTFTGTVAGITKSMVGLGNADDTSDADKPISTATQTALDAKANLSGAVFTGDVETTDLTVTGNLIVQGTTTTISASDLTVKDNMIYLNQAGMSIISNAVGDGTDVVYTTVENHGYSVGDDVTVSGVTPSSFNIASPGYSITAVTNNTFTVESTVTDTYVSDGTSRGKVHSNPDLGWAAGRYDTVNGTGYAHAGLFRDASDGVFKFFDGYEPEPDESVFIDTSDISFALADIAVADISADSIVFSDGTEQTSAGVASLTTFTEKTADYTLDTLAHKDNVVEMNSTSPTTFTVPTDAALAWPIGASMDIFQTNTGEVTIAASAGVTLNRTPGNKLRTRWSSATILKRGTDNWILYGDLKA
jgi:hypothetical protein